MHLQRYMLRYINFSDAFLKKVEATEVFSQPDGLRLGEGGDFYHKVDAKNQSLINHKCVCGALNRHFCQTAVIGILFFVVYELSFKSILPSEIFKTYFTFVFTCLPLILAAFHLPIFRIASLI